MPEFRTEIAIGNFEDIPAIFDVEVEEYPAEPYSWGESRGTETEIRATLKFAQLAHIKLTPEMIGPEEVKRIERHVEETFVI